MKANMTELIIRAHDGKWYPVDSRDGQESLWLFRKCSTEVTEETLKISKAFLNENRAAFHFPPNTFIYKYNALFGDLDGGEYPATLVVADDPRTVIGYRGTDIDNNLKFIVAKEQARRKVNKLAPYDPPISLLPPDYWVDMVTDALAV